MEHIWSSEIDSVLSVGRTLESAGVRNLAFERDAALASLEQLSATGVAALGGDVYSVIGINVESTYDSWYCNRDSGEAQADFVERSVAKAMRYIASYQVTAGNAIFAIVPST